MALPGAAPQGPLDIVMENLDLHLLQPTMFVTPPSVCVRVQDGICEMSLLDAARLKAVTQVWEFFPSCLPAHTVRLNPAVLSNFQRE